MRNPYARVRATRDVVTSEGPHKKLKRGKILGLAAAVVGISTAAAAALLASNMSGGSGKPVTLPSSTASSAAQPRPAATPAALAAAAPIVGQRVEVTGFGSNPGNLKMYEFIPAGMPSDAPLVVVMHGCSQNASAMDDEPGWVQMANTYKFAMVFPETSTANEPNYGCFRSWDVNHNRRGVGESLSIKQMVDWMKANRATSQTRVFATGFSSGAINTSVLLATYPDVFAAGAEMAGHPYRCASTYTEFTNCNTYGKSQTAQQWGDLVRAAYPGYTGPYPRLAIFHGTSDIIVNATNADQVVKQWLNVHQIDDRADVSNYVNGYPHVVYNDSAGSPKVERYYLTYMGHQISINPYGYYAPRCGVYDGTAIPTQLCAVYYAAKWFGIAT
ncbi:MAG: PHB depolymerase family esterase [Novosphingobium sp.]